MDGIVWGVAVAIFAVGVAAGAVLTGCLAHRAIAKSRQRGGDWRQKAVDAAQQGAAWKQRAKTAEGFAQVWREHVLAGTRPADDPWEEESAEIGAAEACSPATVVAEDAAGIRELVGSLPVGARVVRRESADCRGGLVAAGAPERHVAMGNATMESAACHEPYTCPGPGLCPKCDSLAAAMSDMAPLPEPGNHAAYMETRADDEEDEA